MTISTPRHSPCPGSRRPMIRMRRSSATRRWMAATPRRRSPMAKRSPRKRGQAHLRAQLPARCQPEGVDAHQPGDPALGAPSPQRQVPDRTGPDVQPVHPRLDHLLQPLLQDAVASDPEEDRCLCHPVGTSQVQADASPDQRRERLVRPATPCQSNPLRPLDAMSWQRPNIGSRVIREGHARFWERAEVKFLRATRHERKNSNEYMCSELVESRMGAVAWGRWPTPRFPSHRVGRGSHPPPPPTDRSVRISRTTLFGRWFTALREPAAPDRATAAVVGAVEPAL